jgi:hypothetical protein
MIGSGPVPPGPSAAPVTPTTVPVAPSPRSEGDCSAHLPFLPRASSCGSRHPWVPPRRRGPLPRAPPTASSATPGDTGLMQAHVHEPAIEAASCTSRRGPAARARGQRERGAGRPGSLLPRATKLMSRRASPNSTRVAGRVGGSSEGGRRLRSPGPRSGAGPMWASGGRKVPDRTGDDRFPPTRPTCRRKVPVRTAQPSFSERPDGRSPTCSGPPARSPRGGLRRRP